MLSCRTFVSAGLTDSRRHPCQSGYPLEVCHTRLRHSRFYYSLTSLISFCFVQRFGRSPHTKPRVVTSWLCKNKKPTQTVARHQPRPVGGSAALGGANSNVIYLKFEPISM